MRRFQFLNLGFMLFSVGIAHPVDSANSLVTVLASGTGAVVVALQIAYLPAIYTAYNRREALVTLLESRAGLPAWGPELLIRHRLVGITDIPFDGFVDAVRTANLKAEQATVH